MLNLVLPSITTFCLILLDLTGCFLAVAVSLKYHTLHSNKFDFDPFPFYFCCPNYCTAATHKVGFQ